MSADEASRSAEVRSACFVGGVVRASSLQAKISTILESPMEGDVPNPIRFFYEGGRPGLERLTYAEYVAQFADPAVAKTAFEKAWEIRNFEIELYWKRATYFWAFIATAFLGYFGLVNSTGYNRWDRHQHAEIYFLICLGFILSLAWHLTNRGSKQWQRHWEIHVDLLEDTFTGPLYKTVHPEATYSVSKINELVSAAVIGVWLLLGAKYLVDQDLVHWRGTTNWFVLIATAGTMALGSAMLFGYGRGRFGDRKVKMHRRRYLYVDQAEQSSNDAAV